MKRHGHAKEVHNELNFKIAKKNTTAKLYLLNNVHSMVTIHYTLIHSKMEPTDFRYYLELVPNDTLLKINSFHRKQDKLACLFGRVLLQRCLQSLKRPDIVLNDIRYSEYKKPYVDGVSFNITHSADLIACAASSDAQVGLDTEKITNINFEDFKNVFTQSEWEHIHSASHPVSSFFELWTRKESVLKAHGEGLNFPLQELEVINENIILNNAIWVVQPIDLSPGYSTHLATSVKLCVPPNVSYVTII